MNLSGKYVCVDDIFLYTDSIVVGEVVNIISEKVVKLDLPEGYYHHYVEGYYNSWISEDDIKQNFKHMNLVRQEKIDKLM